MAEKFLVTGALGCIGAWTVKRLVAEGVPVSTFDLPGEPRRLRLIMDDAALAKVNFISGDITDFDAFEKAIVDNGITHVVHLAALQVPFVKADPLQGVKVNVVGTANVLEALRRHHDQIEGFTYASSAGIYGPPSMYPPGPLAHDAPPYPTNLYGVHKWADEGMARIYWQDYQLHSIGLRPCVVYGPGRDQGMSSTPTKAMLAAAADRSYHISFGDTLVFQFADDAARTFIQAARKSGTFEAGADCFNIGGASVGVPEVVQIIDKVSPETKGKITYNPVLIGTPEEIDSSALDKAIGKTSWINFEDGVQQTIDILRAGVKANKIDVDRILNTKP